MRLDLHTGTIAAGLLCLAALAWLMWADDVPEAAPIVAPVPEPVAVPALPVGRRLVTYNGGRTLIRPLVSTAAIARRDAA